jgi:hypothetical protein
MLAPKIIENTVDIESLLGRMGISRLALETIARKAVAARNESVYFDPVNAPGQFSYIHGTRALREELIPSGSWVLDRASNIESVFNPTLGIKIVFQNVDVACAMQCPKAISAKGKASKKLVDSASYSLFPDLEREVNREVNASVWYFCVSAIGENIRAELSRPKSIRDSDGQFDDFYERVFVVARDIELVVSDDVSADKFDDELDIQVTRK